MAMLYRVVVNVINMPLVILLIANPMLPVTTLSDAALTFTLTTRRNFFAAINTT